MDEPSKPPMPKITPSWMSSLIGKVGPVPSERIHLYPNIPPDLLDVAKKTFARGMNDEIPLLLVDLSYSGGSKFLRAKTVFDMFQKAGSTGILATDKNIYDGSSWNDNVFHDGRQIFELDKIFSVHLLDYGRGGQRVWVNGVPLFGESPPRELTSVDCMNWIYKVIGEMQAVATISGDLSAMDIISSYRRVLVNKSVFYPNGIPEKFIHNARKTYRSWDPPDEKPLLLYSDGKKGRSGVLLTSLRVFCHADGHEFYREWRLDSIRKIGLSAVAADRKLRIWINDARMYGFSDWHQSCPRHLLVLSNMIVAVANSQHRPSGPLEFVFGTSQYPNGFNFRATEPVSEVPLGRK